MTIWVVLFLRYIPRYLARYTSDIVFAATDMQLVLCYMIFKRLEIKREATDIRQGIIIRVMNLRCLQQEKLSPHSSFYLLFKVQSHFLWNLVPVISEYVHRPISKYWSQNACSRSYSQASHQARNQQQVHGGQQLVLVCDGHCFACIYIFQIAQNQGIQLRTFLILHQIFLQLYHQILYLFQYIMIWKGVQIWCRSLCKRLWGSPQCVSEEMWRAWTLVKKNCNAKTKDQLTRYKIGTQIGRLILPCYMQYPTCMSLAYNVWCLKWICVDFLPNIRTWSISHPQCVDGMGSLCFAGANGNSEGRALQCVLYSETLDVPETCTARPAATGTGMPGMFAGWYLFFIRVARLELARISNYSVAMMCFVGCIKCVKTYQKHFEQNRLDLLVSIWSRNSIGN